jgi:TRAP-type C4-dicarboxylate transport system substrate-binding protein
VRLGASLVVVALLAAGAPASAEEPVVLRAATVAPEGSGWAREGLAFIREVEALTHGRVRIKIYFGGITGDEMQTVEQVRRGRIDIIASGGMSCLALAPTLRVFRVPGLFRNRDEANYVTGRLHTTIDAEFLRAGFINFGEVTVGPDMLFTRKPVRGLADLRKRPLWIWNLDPVQAAALPAIGLSIAPAPLSEALRAFESGRIDGFVAVPTAALAFQWSTQARYLSDLGIGVLRGCVIVSVRAVDALAIEDQRALRTAGAKLVSRLENVGRASDDALLGGLFVKQGVTVVKAPEGFVSEFYDAAAAARDRLPESVVPRALVQRVQALLADYRGRSRK